MYIDIAMWSQVNSFLIVLTKQGGYLNLTQIILFIEPYKHESYHYSKHVNGDEQSSQDFFQGSHNQLV